MRIYEGAPRQNYEDILRSVGFVIDQRGMSEILLAETNDGFMVQGLAVIEGSGRAWNDPTDRQGKETFFLHDDDIARLMDESVARRRAAGTQAGGAPPHTAAFYESALRMLGAYIDQQQPQDIFFLELDRQFIVRLLTQSRTGLRHVLVEFTREEIEAMVANAQQQRPAS